MRTTAAERYQHVVGARRPWSICCGGARAPQLLGQNLWRTGRRNEHQANAPHHFFEACASRQVHYIPLHRKRILADRFQDDVEEAERVWTRIWHLLATLCQTKIWTDRNDVMYMAASIELSGSATCFWSSCLRHLRARAKREHLEG